ncbi:MAG: ABC transporter permease subunit [Myxococcales bacterium]|nr:ABC transporter permease subunit [Myxococcales bacterium]
MRHVASVAGRELHSLFVSPVAYGVLSLFSVLAGLFFILDLSWFEQVYFQAQQYPDQLAEFNLNDGLLSEFYGSISVVLLFLIPGITMGVYAAEKTNGTEELLLTSPLTIWDIVLGKFAAGAIFITVLIGIVGLFPSMLFFYGDPEIGKTVSGLIGLLLTGWTYVAIGGAASAIARSQIVAFLITLVALITLLLLPGIAEFGIAGNAPGVAATLRYLSVQLHFDPLLNGLVDTADLGFFVVMIGSFLVVTKAVVESVRWR